MYNLKASFHHMCNLTFYDNRGADPNQHILDTLEQCISVIIEKMQNVSEYEKPGSRLSSLDYSRTNDGKIK